MYWYCCSNCGNIFGLSHSSAGEVYCPKCDAYFTKNTCTPIVSNATTAFVENWSSSNRIVNPIPYTEITTPEENKLTINAKDIIINDNKIRVAIDKDSIDKFDVIEINGVKFAREV